MIPHDSKTNLIQAIYNEANVGAIKDIVMNGLGVTVHAHSFNYREKISPVKK